jgi:lysylphosphatidylglycerol synthetase-like protein (DUF2156 family)
MQKTPFPLWTFIKKSFKRAHHVSIRVYLASAVALMGLLNGLTVLLPERQGRFIILVYLFNLLAPFAPSVWPIVQTGRTVALILGFFFLLIAFGLARGKRKAWQFALLLLPLFAVARLAKGLDVEEAVMSMLLWGGLLVCRQHFLVGSDPWRMRQGVILLLLGFILLCIYSLGGFYLFQSQLIMPGTFGGILRSWLLRLVNVPSNEILPLTREAAWFMQSIPWLSTAVLLTGMFFLLRPVSRKWWVAYQKDRLVQARLKIAAMVARYGAQAISFFALSPQNLHFMAQQGEGLVSYRLVGNVAMMLGDPVCVSESDDICERVIRQFLELCRLQDWYIALYQAHEEHVSLYRSLGLRLMKIGEEAIIHPQSFSLSGSAMANLRTSCRRAEREEVRLCWYEGPPPGEVLDQMQQLSDAWLEKKGGKQAVEMGFSMGRIDGLAQDAKLADEIVFTRAESGEAQPEAWPRLVTGVAFDHQGRICAFVSFTPIYGRCVVLPDKASGCRQSGWGWALDLMRRRTDAPPGVIELLIVRSIERFRSQGAQVVSLGMVAMADTKQEMTPGQRQVAGFLSDHLRLLESHRSLFRFKQKFHPCWESRYVVFSTALALPKVALALLRVHNS